MIRIARVGDISVGDVVRRSPFAGVAGAEETLKECLHRSIEVRYGLIDGKIACVWGLIPPTILSEQAYLWLITTDIIAEHKFLFVRNAQRYVEEALKQYPELIGEVGDARAVRWLKWLGAEFTPLVEGKIAFTIRKR